MTLTHDELVELVTVAATDVFTTMLGMEPSAGEAYIDSAPCLLTNGVVSLIGLTGPWVGTGSISCSAAFACRIASALMLTEYEAVGDDVLDAIAEVTNMIIGNVKTVLDERLGPMGLSIPTVVYGRNVSSRTVGKQAWTIVPFFAGDERLEVQLCLVPNRDGSRPRVTIAEQQALEV
jgi:chemotaxis protein CheX